MTKVYRITAEIPVTGSVREERELIGKLTSLSKFEEEVKALSGTFTDAIVRVTGERVLKHPAKKAGAA